MDRTTRYIILAVATLAGFVATFAASGIVVATKPIGDEFHLSAVVLSWIPLTYVLAAASILMAMGKIADLYGRMKIFTIGLVGFTIISFAAAVAPSGAWLITLRTLQGLAASLLFATNIALVSLSHPPEVRGGALGILTAGVYLGSTLGPVLGGIIVDHLGGWRGLFVFVGVAALITTVLTMWKLHAVDWKETKQGRFDVLGSIVWAVALPALLLGFTFLPQLLGILLVAGGILGLAFFLWWEARAADPLLRVDLLRHNRAFAFSNAAALINYSATFAMSFLLALYLEYNRGLSPKEFGYVLVAAPLLQTIVSPFAGRLADRLQPRLVAATGQALCVLGLLAFVFLEENTSYWFIIAALGILGIGFGLFASPVAHLVMGSVDRREVGTASATLATMRVSGQGVSMGISGLVIALIVGHSDHVKPNDPNLLTSVRISFAIFAFLCVLGLGAVLLSGKRQTDPQETLPL